MRLLRPLCFALLGLCGIGQSVAAETVSVRGAVLQPGDYQWQEGARLRDAAVAGQVRADAWFLGAALLRESAMEQQQRLKAGLLFDLRMNRLHARSTNNADLLDVIDRLSITVEGLPVTGRVPAELNPFQLLILQRNELLEPGDTLIYPTRPSLVRVMGAVQSDCQLPFDAALALKDYLRQCPAHTTADANAVMVIQPDGRIVEVGIAHWNEQPVNVPVGAIIYRPLAGRVMSPETPDFNRDMAALLATQYQLGGHFSE